NWFQNRRAKAKQQKRQEEFERMQKAKAEAEEAAKGKSKSSDSSATEANEPQNDTTKDTPKPSESSSDDRPQASAPSRSKHQKTRSESAREATFASLQRALNAAVAARYAQDEKTGLPVTRADGSVSPTTLPVSIKDSADVSSEMNTYSEWDPMDQSPLTSAGESLAVPSLDNAQFQATAEDWSHHTKSLSGYRSTSDAEAPYNAMQYALQADVAVTRRGSSDELADSLEGIGINTSHAMSQLGNCTDRASWKEASKELDIAARRKRPRPAAIGTARSSSMLSGAAMSPTTRLPSYGTVKQSKSAQSLNSRYAGVRKASAAQRSPLNLSTFAEAGALTASKAEMSTMLQPVTTGSLAPPTPLTPEDLHHLLPNTPSDGYSLSAQPTATLFPPTQPMQINIASPPATPLAMPMISPYQYQNVAPPMSAPAHYTSFPDYACDGGSLTGRSWTEATSMPSPEASFQGHCQVPQHDMTSMSYEPAMEHSVHSADSVTGSPSFMYAGSEADMHTPSGSYAGDSKRTEFEIMEFPDQKEAHRFVARQLPSHKPKAYTFANNRTPTNF
ncbi:hypothetical protein AOCH_006528, partial [Aspergillus ochraceoroseus]